MMLGTLEKRLLDRRIGYSFKTMCINKIKEMENEMLESKEVAKKWLKRLEEESEKTLPKVKEREGEPLVPLKNGGLVTMVDVNNFIKMLTKFKDGDISGWLEEADKRHINPILYLEYPDWDDVYCNTIDAVDDFEEKRQSFASLVKEYNSIFKN